MCESCMQNMQVSKKLLSDYSVKQHRLIDQILYTHTVFAGASGHSVAQRNPDTYGVAGVACAGMRPQMYQAGPPPQFPGGPHPGGPPGFPPPGVMPGHPSQPMGPPQVTADAAARASPAQMPCEVQHWAASDPAASKPSCHQAVLLQVGCS